ncbi:MAG: Asp-tRNA(Asn)/Glu-tRNA(Gln) amidotransferase subunit GatC [Desulfitobacteriaceae bacterium]|nr:Asp-tRNA(Asn)/Glu-tRNA(Gln) amidotransferase subunit GatC [Desulfitobacteriaceae bacterium]MDD4346689.1 Asp-tRNA(Asn)/Glu-tRNA(Gln) amidotransferase subunit GatC [Desulfitobacteriaceae bacterium]MDD4401144.1 Asp-tRNA(Asn)/Glu-tRNA(Gln) amidotransferase subunit GatC [Desulfitobacteriaceae bacterium]
MKISREEVEYVAMLARLELTAQETEDYTGNLNSILEYAGILEKLDTSEVLPTAHAVPLHNVMREDVVKSSMDAAKVLANAPDVENGFFKVPKIV